jgi:prevent-host-death family protein
VAARPQIPIRTLNQDTAAVLARVEQGEIIEITNRGRPIARIVPVAADRMADLVASDLVASGLALPPTLTGPIPIPTEAAEPGADAGQLICALRDEERW